MSVSDIHNLYKRFTPILRLHIPIMISKQQRWAWSCLEPRHVKKLWSVSGTREFIRHPYYSLSNLGAEALKLDARFPRSHALRICKGSFHRNTYLALTSIQVGNYVHQASTRYIMDAERLRDAETYPTTIRQIRSAGNAERFVEDQSTWLTVKQE